MDASASAAHNDEILTLTLHNVAESEQRLPSKPQAAIEASFESYSNENADSGEHLSMPLTLPASPTMLPLGSSLSSAACRHRLQQLSVQQYFQTENGGAGEFNEEYRRLTDAINLNVPTETGSGTGTNGLLIGRANDESSASTSTPTRKSKRRKQGANVSIDLQTKIRLIEVAEQYQYDPKSSSRSKQDGSLPSHYKEVVNGIRLAEQFGLNKSTVSRILKRKEEFKKAYYKDNVSGCSKHINKKSKFDKLNRLVENWFDIHREKNGATTDTLIREVGKKYAQELGIKDFRGSNGWVRSLRNRKQHAARNIVSIEEQELEKRKKDNVAFERMRGIFPNGMKDMAGFFKDLSTFLEKDGAGTGGFCNVSSNTCNSARDSAVEMTETSFSGMNESLPREDDGAVDEKLLKKKMIATLRVWSQELMASELAKLKKRMKPRQAANL